MILIIHYFTKYFFALSFSEQQQISGELLLVLSLQISKQKELTIFTVSVFTRIYLFTRDGHLPTEEGLILKRTLQTIK